MTTITLEVPTQKAKAYKEIISFFINDVKLQNLQNLKEDFLVSKNLWLEYENSKDWKDDAYTLQTKDKTDKEILAELNQNLWK